MEVLRAELRHVTRLGSLGQMAAILAHEINQPLTAIVTYLQGCQRLLDGTQVRATPQIQDILRKAADQALRAGETIRRIREFVTRGNNERHAENIITLVNEASSLALVGAAQRGIRSSFRFEAHAECVFADRIQIQQVIVNLVRNAIEAMHEAERRQLRIRVVQHERDQVEISISDTGPGISDEVSARLFEPFVTDKPNGMGVGLSICRTIIDAHNGRLWVESQPGRGATFRFTLPVDRGSA
jgi:two-component system sensor kinase FixL